MLPSVLVACAVEDPTYRYGVRLSSLELELVGPDVGVHPDRAVLDDPNNPFARGLVGDAKWEVLEDGPVAGFYAWASMLALQPTGEHQFYTARMLHEIYLERRCRPDDIAFVHDLAIRGYQSVLDQFPGAVTYDATGRSAFALGPLAIHGIEDLGGVVENGWVVVTTADGGETAVQDQ
jgi:hypothetical protein